MSGEKSECACIVGVSKNFLDEVLGFQGFPRCLQDLTHGNLSFGL